MIDFGNLINLQMILFLLIFVGIFASKRGYITPESRKKLSALFINIILPCNIIASFHVELTGELLAASGQILLISLGVQLLSWVFSRILYNRVSREKQIVLRYGTICSNAGFMGNPVIQGVYGMKGLLYASIYLIPLRVIMWSAGLSLFTTTNRKTMAKNLLVHPCIVAVYIGFALMLIQFRIPAFLIRTIDSISACNTAMAMIIIGSILAEVDFRKVIEKWILFFSFVRLILIPLAVLFALRLLNVSELITGIAVLLAGMPAGSTTALLAAQYDCDAEYASKCVLFTTFLSLATIPALGFLIRLVYA